MDSDIALRRLLHVLSERDIGLGREDLEWLFESPETQDEMIAWVKEYLNEDTLLTPEELELYADLDGAQLPSRDRGHDDASARPLEQFDFETSIKALETSTAAVERQCATLEAQLESMRRIQEQNSRPSQPDNASKQPKHVRRRSTMQFSAEDDELMNSLQSRVATSQRQTDNSLTSLKTSAQRQLEKDDRLLDGLQKLVSGLEQPEPQEQQITEVDTLCRALVSLQSTVVKKRINQTYLEAVKRTEATSPHDDPDSSPQPSDDLEITALTEELDSLIEEVESVLDMVVDHQYRRPILDNLKQSEARARDEQQLWLGYVQSVLTQMTERLHDLSIHTKDCHEYGTALQSVARMLQDLAPSREPARTTEPAAKPRPTHKAVRDLVLPANAPTNPALDLLRHHGIRIAGPSLTKDKTKAVIETAIGERRERLAGLAHSTERGISTQVADSMESADAQLQGLLHAVYAYSPYGTVNLADQETKVRLARLDGSIKELGDQLRGVDLGRLVERERDQLESVLSTEL